MQKLLRAPTYVAPRLKMVSSINLYKNYRDFLYLFNSIVEIKKSILVTVYRIKNQQSLLTIHLQLYAGENRNFRIFSGILPYQFSAQYVERFVGCMKFPVMI